MVVYSLYDCEHAHKQQPTREEESVRVSGVSADDVTLKFGIEQSEIFGDLYNNGAFSEFASQKVFEESGEGILASV